MKHSSPIIRWGGPVAAITVACAISNGTVQAGGAKPFKEIGLEPFVTAVTPGSFQQQLFVDARALYGTEVWAGVILHTSHNNVGGNGSGLVFEVVFQDVTAPAGVVVYLLKNEVLANGDQLVIAGYAVPQLDGGYIINLQFVSSESTGRFAGVTGSISSGKATPGPGYIFEGTITTIGGTK